MGGVLIGEDGAWPMKSRILLEMVDPSMNGGQVKGEAIAVEGEGVRTMYLKHHQGLGRWH